MKRMLNVTCFVAASLMSGAAFAQDALFMLGAMVEKTTGEPVASATSVSADAGVYYVATTADVANLDNLCVNIWPNGPCHEADRSYDTLVPDLPNLFVIGFAIPTRDLAEKFQSIATTKPLKVGFIDPSTDEPVAQFITQSAFGGWEAPIDPAEILGSTPNGFTIRSSGLTTYSVGAAVQHPDKGLVGIISQVDPASGLARVIALPTLVDALSDAGLIIADEMRPVDDRLRELPRDVEDEVGNPIIFQDYSSLPQGLTLYYAPSGGFGFEPTFQAEVIYRVLEIDPGTPAGRVIATGSKRTPFVSEGFGLEAPYQGIPPDLVATCVFHQTPSSNGRNALVMNFWRAVPVRENRNTGNKSYDETAASVVGWADGETPCLDRIGQLPAEVVAALRGGVSQTAPSPETGNQPTIDADGWSQTTSDWGKVDFFEPTGQPAYSTSFGIGQELSISCTGSGELFLSISPSDGVEAMRLESSDPYETGTNGPYYYAFFSISEANETVGNLVSGIISDSIFDTFLPAAITNELCPR